MRLLSLFSGGGIGESRLDQIGIKVIAANEIIKERCEFYSLLNPTTEIFNLDISKSENFKKILSFGLQSQIDIISATPPCQGMSIAGNMVFNDERNHLIYFAIEMIKSIKPKFVFLENVPRQLQTYINYRGENIKIPDYIFRELNEHYFFNKNNLIKAMNYEIPQMRQRNIMLLSRKDQNYIWEFPSPDKKVIDLKEAIGHLPSLDPILKEGMQETLKLFPDFLDKKNISKEFSKWHTPPTHSKKHVLTMQKTPTGMTAFDNLIFYPKKDDGIRVSGHYNHYRRLSWDKPSRSLTQNNGVISSLACVHPGRVIKNGDEKERIFSDPRCFSIEELFIISSINFQNKIPINTKHSLIRKLIGEGIPPLLVEKIFRELLHNFNHKN